MRSSIVRSRFRAEVWVKVWLPLILVAATIGLGWIGFHRYYHAIGQPISVGEALFHAAGLPLQETAVIDDVAAGQVPLVLNIARVLGLFVIPYAFVLAFVALFGTLTRPLRIRSWSWRVRRGRRGHAVVCGLGMKGLELVRDLVEKGERVAVLESDPDNGLLPAARDLGAIVIIGDARQASGLGAVHVTAAERVFVVCDSDDTNIRAVKQIAALVGGGAIGRGAIECSVELREGRTREFAHRTVGEGPALAIRSFDTYESTARQLMGTHPLDPAAGAGVVDEIRVVVLGDSSMARALVTHALSIGHFPPGRGVRLRIMAEGAERAQGAFLREHPIFAPGIARLEPALETLRREVFPDVEFLELPASDMLLLDETGPLLTSVRPRTATRIFVCLDDGTRSAAHLSTLLPSIATTARRRGADVQVFYYDNDTDDDHRLLVERRLRQQEPGVPVHSFGNFVGGCSVDRVQGRPADDLAQQIAAFYRETYGGEEWARLPESDRASNRSAADHIPVKLRSIGAEAVGRAEADPDFAFTEAEVALLAEIEHRRWCAEKLLSGWRPLPRTPEARDGWQREKSVLKAQKRHMDLVPFDQLDAYEKGKDRSQILGIPRFLRALGLGIRRHQPPPGNDRGARSTGRESLDGVGQGAST